MRSVVVVSDYSPAFLGGAQRAMRNQVVALARAGHRVTVIAPVAPAEWVPDDVVIEQRVPRAAGPRLAGMPVIVNSPARRAWFTTVLRDVRADLVIVHSEFGLAAAALDAAARERVRSLHVVHTFFWTAPIRRLLPLARVVAALLAATHRRATASPTIERRRLAEHPLDDALRGMTLTVARRADVVVSPSHHQAQALRRAGLPRVRAVSNVVIDTPAHGVPFYPDGGPLRLVWAGRCTPEKGLLLAVRAVLLAERTLGAGAIELHVAGEGPQLRSARSAAADSAAVRWYGRLPAHQVGMLVADGDAVIVSSWHFDNQPMIALEGFHAGRPVIVVDPRLAGEFGEAALLAPEPEDHALASLLVSLATDRGRLAAASAAARERAESSGAAAHVAELLLAADSAR